MCSTADCVHLYSMSWRKLRLLFAPSCHRYIVKVQAIVIGMRTKLFLIVLSLQPICMVKRNTMIYRTIYVRMLTEVMKILSNITTPNMMSRICRHRG